ncbi:MAG: Mg2+ and Co2+ transporter CorB [Firmicutes bacterium HGW-Firmicutes-1]|nr:MAG: Mg2+ and Co2+ transporter CorB [Firmicutes bacterium HGW-Firmicutes-1]
MYNLESKEKKTKVKFRSLYTHRSVNYSWIMVVTIITFFISIILGYFSLVITERVSLYLAIIVLLLIVFTGVFFDLLGIAVTAAEETPFHAMASHRLRGAKESITILRNAGPVANFFNDVIGDISGIISGSASAAILIKINQNISVQSTLASLILTAIIAAITVGGKAIGKEIALRHANYVVFKMGYIISFFSFKGQKK